MTMVEVKSEEQEVDGVRLALLLLLHAKRQRTDTSIIMIHTQGSPPVHETMVDTLF